MPRIVARRPRGRAMKSGLLLLVMVLSAGAVGYLEITYQAAREAWRAETVRLTGRLQEAERLAEENTKALSGVDTVRRQEREAKAKLADLETRILDAAADLALLESERAVANDRAEAAMHDLKEQVRALTTIEIDLAALDKRRRRIEWQVETAGTQLQQAELGAAERQKRAEQLDRDVAALAIRRETLRARVKSTEADLAGTALAALAEGSVEATDLEAPSPAPPPTPATRTAAVDRDTEAEDKVDPENVDRTLGLYQFDRLTAEPAAASGGQGGLPPSSQEWPDALDQKPDATDWAKDQYLMGLNLLSSAEQSSGVRELNDAVLAFKAVLGEWSKDRDPMRWAIAQSDLGYALALLGKRQGKANVLDQAATACRHALGEFERQETPLLWAAAQHHLGVSLGGLADVSGDPALRQASIEALEQAVDVFMGAGADADAKKATIRLRETKAQLPTNSTAPSE